MRSRQTFPDRLHELRTRQGLTQSELARLARMPPAAISHFERGYRVPTSATLERLAEALGVSVDLLLGRDAPPQVSGATMRALFRNAEGLSEKALKELETFSLFLRDRDRKGRNE